MCLRPFKKIWKGRDKGLSDPTTKTVFYFIFAGSTGEEKRREEERGEKEVETVGEIKDEKWKANYVPYEENTENTENKTQE